MSPVSRGRRTKSGQTVKRRQIRRQESPYAAILREAAGLPAETSMFVAENWASSLVGVVWANAWTDESIDAPVDEIVEVYLGGLVEYLASDGSPAAVAALRALGSVGEDWVREPAAEAADRLVSSGAPEPAWWTTKEPRLTTAFVTADPFGEVEFIVSGFERDGVESVLAVVVFHIAGPRIMRIISGRPDGGVGAMIDQVRADGGLVEPVELTADDVRARLEEATELLLDEGPMPVTLLEDIMGDLVAELDGDPAVGWPLLRARLDTLPAVEVPDHVTDLEVIEDAAGAFLASGYADAVPDRVLAGRVALLAASWASDTAGAPYRIGPLSMAHLLLSEVAEHIVIADEDVAGFRATIEAWARFTVDVAGLDPKLVAHWEERFPRLWEDFAEAYADRDAVSHRMTCPDTQSLREYVPMIDDEPDWDDELDD
jgi:hypothetical protein